MVFSSVVFIFLFLPSLVAIYFPFRNVAWAGNVILLVASLLFYFWGEGVYLIVMLCYIFVNFFFGICIEKAHQFHLPNLRKWILGLAVTLNIGGIIYYKYAHFLLENISFITGISMGGVLSNSIHLPIGISFYTFQSIS